MNYQISPKHIQRLQDIQTGSDGIEVVTITARHLNAVFIFAVSHQWENNIDWDDIVASNQEGQSKHSEEGVGKLHGSRRIQKGHNEGEILTAFCPA